jgi:hypothetical protein
VCRSSYRAPGASVRRAARRPGTHTDSLDPRTTPHPASVSSGQLSLASISTLLQEAPGIQSERFRAARPARRRGAGTPAHASRAPRHSLYRSILHPSRLAHLPHSLPPLTSHFGLRLLSSMPIPSFSHPNETFFRIFFVPTFRS